MFVFRCRPPRARPVVIQHERSSRMGRRLVWLTITISLGPRPYNGLSELVGAIQRSGRRGLQRRACCRACASSLRPTNTIVIASPLHGGLQHNKGESEGHREGAGGAGQYAQGTCRRGRRRGRHRQLDRKVAPCVFEHPCAQVAPRCPASSAGTAAPTASEATGAYLKQAGALNEYVCPLTAEIMTDPVSTLDGFTYERTVITEWLRTNDTSQSTGAKLESKRHVPNPTVRCLLRHL